MASNPQKILIIRLSSIGDIVMCSPVIRSLRACHPQAEIHFLTKKAFIPLLKHNPHLNRVHGFAGDMKATVQELKAEGFDFILDLHRNIRSRIIKSRLGIPAATYSKHRLRTTAYLKFRIGSLPTSHVIERYGATLAKLGCQPDGGGMEFFLSETEEKAGREILAAASFSEKPIAVVLGGGFATKQWPARHWIALLNRLNRPVVFLGGPSEQETEAEIAAGLQGVPFLLGCGKHPLLVSAALLQGCAYAIAHDTGFMHIAAALGLPVFSLWGNTVPELGFRPYLAEGAMIENKGIGCRPCSKLGYEKCPKGHFRCMNELLPEQVLAGIEEYFAALPS